MLEVYKANLPSLPNPMIRISGSTAYGIGGMALEFYNQNNAYVMAQVDVEPGGGYIAPIFKIRVSDTSMALQDRLAILTTGRVGIGTLNPVSLLDVNGAASATSGANFNSGAVSLTGSYWNGSGPVVDSWSISNVLGSGTNPTSTLTIGHTGTSGQSIVSIQADVMFNNDSRLSSSGGIMGVFNTTFASYNSLRAANLMSFAGFFVGLGGKLGFTGLATPGTAADTAFYRLSANVVTLGNATNNDFTGTLCLSKVIIGATTATSPLHVANLPVYADNATALGALGAGGLYRNGDTVCVAH
jgi:hypothetical protein